MEKIWNTLQEYTCRKCKTTKSLDCFYWLINVCKDCNNQTRRTRYKEDPEFRWKHIQSTTEHAKKKVIERRQKKQAEIGIGNKKCSCCDQIKPEAKFRHNRLKCRDCERDDPIQKFNRAVRSRIYLCLKRKSNHTIEYLGCNYEEYHAWIFDHNYNLDNRSDWHIDHVIPLSSFDLDDPIQQMLAFNWRNTTPLPSKQNLAKNNRIDTEQVEQHWKKLVEYHQKKMIDIPEEFVELFRRRDQIAGTP